MRIIEETLAPEAVVNEVARRYDIHPHQLQEGSGEWDFEPERHSDRKTVAGVSCY